MSLQYKTIELLRKYCLNDRPVRFEVLSDPAENFHNSFGTVNYEDPNFNVGLPFFIIHGNHDDPTGSGALPGETHLSALDILSGANLINYFGKATDIKDIEIAPILIRKGDTKIALYGLGNIRDERLYQTWKKEKNVKWLRPEQKQDEWFNMFVLHQNRVVHDAKKCVHNDMLPDFLDFVIWGHEHEAKHKEEESDIEATTIYQPGSSVATSLCEGEAQKKAIGILEIYKDTVRFQIKYLKTTRSLIVRTIELETEPGVHFRASGGRESVERCLKGHIENMIEEAARTYRHDPMAPEQLKLPLVRLRVQVSADKDPKISPQRFGQQFVGKVANPQELLLFSRTKVQNKAKAAQLHDLAQTHTDTGRRQTGAAIMSVLSAKLKEQGSDLKIFGESELSNALKEFVEKEETSAFADHFAKSINETQTRLMADGGATMNAADPEDREREIENAVDKLQQQKEAEQAQKQRRADRRAQMARDSPSNGVSSGNMASRRSDSSKTSGRNIARGGQSGRRGVGQLRQSKLQLQSSSPSTSSSAAAAAAANNRGSSVPARSSRKRKTAAAAQAKIAAAAASVDSQGSDDGDFSEEDVQDHDSDGFVEQEDAGAGTFSSTARASKRPRRNARKYGTGGAIDAGDSSDDASNAWEPSSAAIASQQSMASSKTALPLR